MATAVVKKGTVKKVIKRTRKVKRKRGFSIKLLVIFVGLTLLIKHSIIFLMAGMLPTIVASIVDQSESRLQFKTVACLNFAGIAPFLAELMMQNHASPAVQNVMSDPATWLVVFCMASVGWLLVWFCPWLVKFSIEFFSDNKVKNIESEQQKLIEEWGEEIRGATGEQS